MNPTLYSGCTGTTPPGSCTASDGAARYAAYVPVGGAAGRPPRPQALDIFQRIGIPEGAR
jgi:hypothetical protein